MAKAPTAKAGIIDALRWLRDMWIAVAFLSGLAIIFEGRNHFFDGRLIVSFIYFSAGSVAMAFSAKYWFDVYQKAYETPEDVQLPKEVLEYQKATEKWFEDYKEAMKASLKLEKTAKTVSKARESVEAVPPEEPPAPEVKKPSKVRDEITIDMA